MIERFYDGGIVVHFLFKQLLSPSVLTYRVGLRSICIWTERKRKMSQKYSYEGYGMNTKMIFRRKKVHGVLLHVLSSIISDQVAFIVVIRN